MTWTFGILFFVLGSMFGGSVGFITLALMVAAKNADRDLESYVKGE